ELADRLTETPLGALASDAGCAAEFAAAAIAACAYNVRINHRYMHDGATVAAQEGRLERYERDATEILERARAAVTISLAKP
ncbi:MAG: cyclodeaminase/cyclohydrolase family protein, partial [Candidatus Eremiobacteraeota bacterium]|nr:cyclodeaminase/cyclohydrolase family protein [Candidatus Eremiobacteraeota bacterium]